MRKRQKGFSLIEILITIVLLGIIMVMNAQLLQSLIWGQGQQAAIVSSQFETALGIEILRNDILNAGFGLPDQFGSALSGYSEALSSPAQLFNDAPNVPRAMVHSNDMSAFSGSGYLSNSDYLVIKSPAVGMNSAAGKWSYITGTTVHVWNDPSMDMVSGSDYMIVIKPVAAKGGNSELIVDSGTYSLQYMGAALSNTAFQPTGAGVRYLVFGIDQGNIPRMPFNRADYFIKQDLANPNPNCATGTGQLIKQTVSHADGSLVENPLIECVASMQVIFKLDTNLDGVPDSTVNSLSGLDAFSVKQQVKEVQVYILAHEGTLDKGFTYGGVNPVTVGSTIALGVQINLNNFGGTDWDHYRWKLYTLIVKPKSFY